MKKLSRFAVILAVVTTFAAGSASAQSGWFTNLATNPKSTSTQDNIGIANTASTSTVVAVPFYVGKTGLLISGTAFYNFRVEDPAGTHGFVIGYDSAASTGLLAALANNSIAFWTYDGVNFAERMRVATTGNVGIGVTNPTQKLDVAGNVNVSGNIAAKYQDVAEWVPATEPLKPGMVVVLNTDKSNEVMASLHAYDTAVAGVVSHKPGVILGEAAKNKEQIATSGRVLVYVDATKSPIKVGDLLVTSEKPGVAMKSEPIDVAGVKMHRPGTIVGKALQPLEKGEGEILVLLSLQ
jgi:hypothetical protein